MQAEVDKALLAGISAEELREMLEGCIRNSRVAAFRETSVKEGDYDNGRACEKTV